MSRVSLGSIVRRGKDAPPLLSGVQAALGPPSTITDAAGRILQQGEPVLPGTGRHPVTHDGTVLGWVEGAGHPRAVADVLEHLAAREEERRALGAEVLHLYREVNFIYGFSEKLAALLDLEGVARLTLQEARHLIVATDGIILLMDEDSGAMTPLASFGDAFAAVESFQRGEGVIGTIARSGVAEVIDDLDADPRRAAEGTGLRSVICAPLKVGERVIGVVALGSSERLGYTAADLKLFNTLGLQTGAAIENARLFERTIEAARERERLMALHQAAEVARARLDSEMALAARIQADLFPAALPEIPGYDLAARNRAARHCGGDYYDALRLTVTDGSEHVLLCVADVSGKGVPASLLMSNMQATLRALFGRCGSLPELAAEASTLLFATTSASRYVTAALLNLEPASGAAVFVGAGHLDNCVLKGDGGMQRLCSTGTPLGLLPLELPYGESTLRIEAGDCLLLYSDGVTDAQNLDSEEFGDERLHAVARALADQPAAAIVAGVFDAIDAFAGPAPQFDDITLMVLKRLA